jgi:SEC-C motif-containing protein
MTLAFRTMGETHFQISCFMVYLSRGRPPALAKPRVLSGARGFLAAVGRFDLHFSEFVHFILHFSADISFSNCGRLDLSVTYYRFSPVRRAGFPVQGNGGFLMSDACPCGSGLTFETCCEPFLIEREKPLTAATLMRCRYCAYALGAVDYLYKTSGPKVRQEFDAESSRKWAESAKWTGIEVLQEEGGGAADETGVVEFIAHYAVNETSFDHHERAEFAKIDGEWRFIDGKIFGPDPVRRDQPKIGRNDPCPCGSGKKFKKCCALSPATP